MSIRQIRNETIYAEIGENITLPSELFVIEDGVEVGKIAVDSWYPTDVVDTSRPADLVFIAEISGVTEEPRVSVIVNGIDGARCFSISV